MVIYGDILRCMKLKVSKFIQTLSVFPTSTEVNILYLNHIKFRYIPEISKSNIFFALSLDIIYNNLITLRLSELTPMIFHRELTHLGTDASN